MQLTLSFALQVRTAVCNKHSLVHYYALPLMRLCFWQISHTGMALKSWRIVLEWQSCTGKAKRRQRDPGKAAEQDGLICSRMLPVDKVSRCAAACCCFLFCLPF